MGSFLNVSVICCCITNHIKTQGRSDNHYLVVARAVGWLAPPGGFSASCCWISHVVVVSDGGDWTRLGAQHRHSGDWVSSEQWELSLHTASVRSFSTWLLPYSQGGSSSFFWEARCGHRVPTTEHHTEDSAGYVADFSLIMVLWLIRSVWPLSLLWIALINPGRSALFLLSALNIEFGLVATFSPARLSCPS